MRAMRARFRFLELFDSTAARQDVMARPLPRRILKAVQRASITAVIGAVVRFVADPVRMKSPEHLSAVYVLVVAIFVLFISYVKVRRMTSK